MGQFVRDGSTDCASCHSVEGWTTLVFVHNTQSGFPLTGAHANVQCAGCHAKENIAGQLIVRFKPVPSKCESCHAQGELRNGG